MGNEVEIGRLYGYSSRSSGFVTVVVGKATGTTNKSVSLKVIHRGHALYNEPVTPEKSEKPTVAVVPNTIFPLASSDVHWEEWEKPQSQPKEKDELLIEKQTHTYAEWKALGYQVTFGAKALYRDARGPVFSFDQVVEDYDEPRGDIPREYRAEMDPDQDSLYMN
jgi:hypothetical protein